MSREEQVYEWSLLSHCLGQIIFQGLQQRSLGLLLSFLRCLIKRDAPNLSGEELANSAALFS